MKIKEILDFLQTARIPFSFTGDPDTGKQARIFFFD